MKRLLDWAALATVALWILVAATPQPSRGVHVGNVTPTCNATTGVCTLPDTPLAGTLLLAMNGIVQKQTEDYAISGNTITPVAANASLYADATVVKVAFYVK